MKNVANFITCLRIVLGICLLFLSPFEISFYILYSVGGFTDFIDGTVARKTGSVSIKGERLDTIADFVFLTTSFIKILPVLNLEVWAYIWIITIALIKIFSVVFGIIRFKKFIAVHSNLNKITGLLLFLLPIALIFVDISIIAVLLCIIASVSAVQEFFIIVNQKRIKSYE